MIGGPFRDALTPRIAEARQQLAELQQQRTALEIRYERARIRLDEKVAETRSVDPVIAALREDSPIPAAPPGTFRKAFVTGLIAGLITWLPIFGGRSCHEGR